MPLPSIATVFRDPTLFTSTHLVDRADATPARIVIGIWLHSLHATGARHEPAFTKLLGERRICLFLAKKTFKVFSVKNLIAVF